MLGVMSGKGKELEWDERSVLSAAALDLPHLPEEYPGNVITMP